MQDEKDTIEDTVRPIRRDSILTVDENEKRFELNFNIQTRPKPLLSLHYTKVKPIQREKQRSIYYEAKSIGNQKVISQVVRAINEKDFDTM